MIRKILPTKFQWGILLTVIIINLTGYVQVKAAGSLNSSNVRRVTYPKNQPTITLKVLQKSRLYDIKILDTISGESQLVPGNISVPQGTLVLAYEIKGFGSFSWYYIKAKQKPEIQGWIRKMSTEQVRTRAVY